MTVRIRAGRIVRVGPAGRWRIAADTDPSAPRTPQEALGLLKAGNDRFARNASSPVSFSVNRRRELADAQHPIAIVLSCADSRVPPEFVFNVGLGDLFVVRTAGEVIDRSILANHRVRRRAPAHSPARRDGTRVLRRGESRRRPEGRLTQPESRLSAESPFKPPAGRRPAATPAARARTRSRRWCWPTSSRSINDAMTRSPLLQHLVDAGRLSVVGAYYELVSGRVIFSAPVTAETDGTRDGEALTCAAAMWPSPRSADGPRCSTCGAGTRAAAHAAAAPKHGADPSDGAREGGAPATSPSARVVEARARNGFHEYRADDDCSDHVASPGSKVAAAVAAGAA